MTTGDELARIRSLLGSDAVADVELAHALALAAMRTDPQARPVAAAAYDRLRMLAGAPQKFGTQTIERAGCRELWPVDAATTDSERAKWGLPSLAELQRRAVTG